MRWACVLFSLILACPAAAQDPALDIYRNAATKWEEGISQQRVDSKALESNFSALLKAWIALGNNGRSGSIDRRVASAYRDLIYAFDKNDDFTRVANALNEYYSFCEDNDTGLLGREAESLERFTEVHARVSDALKSDPLAGKKLPYELAKTDRGYEAFAEIGSYNGERVAEFESIVLEELPLDETIGEYLQFDKSCRFVRKLPVGLKYPSDGSPLRQRLRSLYVITHANEGLEGHYERQDPQKILLGEEIGSAGPPKVRREKAGSHRTEGTVTKRNGSTGNRNVILIGLMSLVLLLAGFLFFRQRRS